jgi:hypothetical protein
MELIQYSLALTNLSRELYSIRATSVDTELSTGALHSHTDSLLIHENLLSTLEQLVDSVKVNISRIKQSKKDCLDAQKNKKNTQYVYHAASGILDCNDIDIEAPIIITKTQLIPEISYRCKIPTVKNERDVPHAFYFCEETSKVLININGCICAVPFPEVVDARTQDRCRTLRCKFGTLQNCMKKNYTCSFAHTGEKLKKINYQSVCSRIIGNSSFISDITQCSNDDLQSMLLYGLHDVFCAYLYLTHRRITGVSYSRLDSA